MHILLERGLAVRQCRHSFLNVRHLEIVLRWAVSHPLRFSDEPEHSQLSVGFVVFQRSVFNRRELLQCLHPVRAWRVGPLLLGPLHFLQRWRRAVRPWQPFPRLRNKDERGVR